MTTINDEINDGEREVLLSGEGFKNYLIESRVYTEDDIRLNPKLVGHAVDQYYEDYRQEALEFYAEDMAEQRLKYSEGL